MSGRHEALLALLIDGALHSGADLAAALGVSRAAVWKLVGELRGSGVPVVSLPRSGYHLPRPVELLDADRIARVLETRGWAPGQHRLEVLFEAESTNTWLYDAPAPAPGQPRVAFAELQQAGRGRRGRAWLAPFGSGLTFSISWTFADAPAGLPALGLAVGVGVAEALRRLGLEDAQVKWPNDLVWQGRKLGGLLLQLRAESGGPANVVAGLGINVALPQDARASLYVPGAQPVTDLAEALAGPPPGRNDLAAALAAAMLDTFDEFAQHGYAPFARRWGALDALAGRRVQVALADSTVVGEACGADTEGALLVRVDGDIQRFHSGDVSLRSVPS
jgi:BirA family transcriptional regulator, biotin operon repressor / biotin---[acetyl-CoA-carboxylase] ligase